MKKLLVTAALPYSTGRPHVGHIAGAYLPADIYVRFQRLLGRDVRFICGSDDHGVAIMLTAQKEGKTPAEVAEFYHDKQAKAFEGLNIDFDIYSSTSRCPYHEKTSQDFFLKIYEGGYFSKKKTKQFYDEAEDIFLPDRFVTGTCSYCKAEGQNGDQCENCGKALDVDTLLDAKSVYSGKAATLKETVHWYLDLTKFEKEVENWISQAKLRSHTKKFVSGLLGSGFVERSMTRDIPWGIPVPLDDPDAKGKVLYVWFDAPIGYISNTKELCEKRDGDPEKYADWWKSEDTEILHFIGEDNSIFHCVIWIAMLKAEGSFRLPEGVIVNNFLNIQFPDQKEAEKISKSRGTAVWIEDYLEEGANPDSLRYYLSCIAPEKARTVYKPEDLIQKHNADLANTLGNLVNRIVSFTRKHCEEKVPALHEEKIEDIDLEFRKRLEDSFQKTTELLESCNFKQAQEEVMDFARACNKYVDDRAPWASRKTDMAATERSLFFALEGIRYLGIVLAPFLPESSRKIRGIFGIDESELSWAQALERLDAGQVLSEAGILFEKLDPLA